MDLKVWARVANLNHNISVVNLNHDNSIVLSEVEVVWIVAAPAISRS